MPSRRGGLLGGRRGLLGDILVVLLPLLLRGQALSPSLGASSRFAGVGPLPSDTNRCSNSEYTNDTFYRGCGAPLASPCFNFSRCSLFPAPEDAPSSVSTRSSNSMFGGVGDGGGGGAGASGVKIYVFDSLCSLSDSDSIPFEAQGEPLARGQRYAHALSWVFRNAAREAGVLAATYDSACMFIHVGWREPEPCPVNTPLWNNGSNHVMINFGDGGREARWKVATSFAIDAASNMRSCLYRSGYDISLPLFPRTQFHYLADIPPSNRRFFLTTKGMLYPGGLGSEERQSVVPLHDESNRVIVAMHCLESHGEHLLPEFLTYCQQLKDGYDDYDYASLMNTTFGLVPAGRSPASYRLAEVMGSGAIPVLVARDYVQPFREQIDWSAFSFLFSPDRVELDMMATLRGISQRQLEEMQRKSLEAYGKMFRRDDDADTLVGPPAFAPSAKLLIEILLQRMGFRGR